MDGSADLPFFLFPRFCGVCVTLQNRLCIAACLSLIPSAHERHDHGPCPSACPCPDQQIAKSGHSEATESKTFYEFVSILNIFQICIYRIHTIFYINCLQKLSNCRVPSLCLFLSVPLEASHSALVEHHRIHNHLFSSNVDHKANGRENL